ncbi:MAG TPA: hypothetical protein VFN71_14430 [Methylomirabilota bacterium]|nr:hypothetical protein [Methylomirabilota bacterium]
MSDRPTSTPPPPALPTVQENLDGTATEYFDVGCAEDRLLAILRDIFEAHWDRVIFGPCIEGAVFEGRFSQPPRVSLLDGYATVQVEDGEAWHFHLCIGPHRGSATLPTPPALAAWRRCARAAFFMNRDRAGRPSAWGFRMWNGRGEQMLTVFFPNPWIDPARRRYVDTPDWSRLQLWMTLREKWAAVPPEPPPVGAEPPRTH